MNNLIKEGILRQQRREKIHSGEADNSLSVASVQGRNRNGKSDGEQTASASSCAIRSAQQSLRMNVCVSGFRRKRIM